MSQQQTGKGNNTRAAPPPPKTWATPAAYLFGGVNGDIIGDKSFLDGDIKVTLGSFKIPDLNPWIGFSIEIPRGSPNATEAAGFGPAGIPGIADTLVISVKFPRDTQILVEEVVGNVAANIRTAEAKWDACVEAYPARIPELCNHKVDDKLVLSTRRPHSTETNATGFEAKSFETRLKAVERKVNTPYTILPGTNVKATHSFGFPGLEISVCRALYQDFMLGAGFLTSLQQHFVHDYIDTGLDLMDSLPALNFLAGENQTYQEALLDVAFPDNRDRIRLYLSKVHLGMAVVIGPAGTGKTTVAAVFTLSLLRLLGSGYSSAPTHAAVSKFAERLDAVDEWVARKISGEPDDIYNTSPTSNPSEPAPASTSAPSSEYTVPFLAADSFHSSLLVNNIGLERHLIVRGFEISTEVQAFEVLLQRPKLGDDAVRFISWTHRSR
ncbi:hypothetical protein VSDG_08417 [Cytospora chrysosperma]|uniref:DNA2/NAM7 helicase helicase domain-containing protein n=1 Tax=Cytospora chrysosperma TaxID=252740 RepID=A0A423VHK4_CYTCH|nr:hypothetical protein VSDG_08417 [Valsa sordida]